CPTPAPVRCSSRCRRAACATPTAHYREGGIGDDFPYLLGHEAAGTIDAVGPGVTAVAPGDFVILNWRAVCGECRACRRGKPWYCFATHNAKQPMTLGDGTTLSPALGIGAFAPKTLVAAGQATKVNPSARPEAAGPPTATEPTSASKPSGSPRCSSRRSTRAISRERSCRSASPPRTWHCPTSR